MTLEKLPESKSAAVSKALHETFAVTEPEDIRQLTVGLSTALIFRIVVKGSPYLLRVNTRTDAMGDLTHHLTCMKPAAEASLAPRIHYANTEDRILITDFVEGRPFCQKEAARLLPLTLRAMHALPPFPPTRLISNYYDAVDGMVRRFEEAKIMPESEIEDLIREYEKMSALYRRLEPDMVASHNDLKPENMIFDGHRVWLIDWEAAFLNDRYLDLSVVANFVTANQGDEETYLHAYFGEPAGEYRRARFYIMRQMLHMAYGSFLSTLGAAGKPVDPTVPVPGFRDFHDGMWKSEITLKGNDTRLQYGRVHLNQLWENIWTPRYHESLRLLSERTNA
jgi:hypothetical protein